MIIKSRLFQFLVSSDLWMFRQKPDFVYHISSREQKQVSISDTPMLLIEINSISNMGRQK